MNSKQSIVGHVLFYLFGGSQFFIGIQIIQIGNYGIQPSIVIAFLIFLHGIIAVRRVNRFYPVIFLVALLFLSCLTFIFTKSDNTIFYHSTFILLMQIAIFLTLNELQKLNFYLSGYIHMAFASSMLAILQSISPVSDYIPYFLNNKNFLLVSSEVGRGFGITPEPSILASLLVPLIPAFIFTKIYGLKRASSDPLNVNFFIMGIIIVGLVATRSQSLVFLIPILLFFVFIFPKEIRNKVFFPKKLSITSILYRIFTPILFLITVFYVLLPVLNSRFDSGDAGGSFQIRFNSVMLPLQNSLESPVLGNGFGSSRILVESNQQLFESAGGGLKAGVDSVFARIIYEQGYPYFFVLVLGIVAIIMLFRLDYSISLFFLGTVLCAAFVYGYRDFLTFPFVFAIMLKSGFLLKAKKIENKDLVANL